MQRASTSLQNRAIQRHKFGVDNNLYGVSGQVTAPGVLVINQIFGALQAGKGGGLITPGN